MVSSSYDSVSCVVLLNNERLNHTIGGDYSEREHGEGLFLLWNPPSFQGGFLS